jgi:hypothetical protein
VSVIAVDRPGVLQEPQMAVHLSGGPVCDSPEVGAIATGYPCRPNNPEVIRARRRRYPPLLTAARRARSASAAM